MEEKKIHTGIDMMTKESCKQINIGAIGRGRKTPDTLLVKALISTMSIGSITENYSGDYGNNVSKVTPQQRSDVKNGQRTIGASAAKQQKKKRKMAKQSKRKNRK